MESRALPMLGGKHSIAKLHLQAQGQGPYYTDSPKKPSILLLKKLKLSSASQESSFLLVQGHKCTVSIIASENLMS